MNPQPRPCLIVAGASVLLAHAVFATHPVPRSTFGRAPIRPADLSLLTSPERTPLPTTFRDLVLQERSLPITALTARNMTFEQQLTPIDPLVPKTPRQLVPADLRFTPAPRPARPPAKSTPDSNPLTPAEREL